MFSPPARGILLVTIAALLAHPAAAQWPTTQWKVTQQKGTLRADRLTFLETELQRSSVWLQTLGFAAPDVQLSGTVAGTPMFRGVYDDALSGQCGNVGALYRSSDRTLYFGKGLFESTDSAGVLTQYDASNLADSVVTLDEGYLLAPVHEVFHGVQHTMLGDWANALDWLTESTAEAVRYAWGERTYGTMAVHRRMSYDLPLHQPFTGAGCAARSEWYRSGHLWYHLGGDIGSVDRIAYLRDVMQALVNDQSHNGLGAVASALAPHQGGLYNLYPQFLARHARDTSYYRYEQIVSLDQITPVHIDRQAQLKPLQGMAASAWLVSATVAPGTTAGLTIQLEQDHPDLHLVVDSARYDVPPPRRQRNVFRTSLDGQPAPYEFLVRVVNVAPDPVQSDDRPFTIEFRLADVDVCDPSQLWAATHPTAQLLLMPPQQYRQQYESGPGTRPSEGTLQIQGLIADGGSSCMHSLSLATNPAAPDTAVGRRLQQLVQQMSPQEMMAMAQRMMAQSPGGRPPTPEEMVRALSEESAVDSLMTKSTMLHVFSPNAVDWQKNRQQPSIATALSAYTKDSPAVPWAHNGIGGWQSNAGGHAFIIIQDVGPHALREDTTYAAVGAMHYSRGEGVLKKSRSQVNQNSDASWQGLEGWIEQVQSDPSTEPYSLRGTVTIERVTGAAVEGTYQLNGMGNYRREECPPNPQNLASVSRQCTAQARDGAVSVSGRFSAPLVARPTP